MKKLSEINEGWGSLVRRDLTGEVRAEDDQSMKINAFMHKRGISKYTIKGNTVDVDGDVYLSRKDCHDGKIPFKFGKVSGSFYCSFNKLTSLEGAPKEVGGDFDISFNHLTSLKGAPKKVKGKFICKSCVAKFTKDDVRAVCDTFKIEV